MKKNILIISVIMFVVSSVFLTIESVTSSAEVSSLNQRESQLLAQKRQLEEDLVRGVSVTNLEERGVELGFAKAKDIVYLGNNSLFANLPQ